MPLDLKTLNEIAARVTAGEFHLFLSMYRSTNGTDEAVSVTLEKGSSYGGGFHLRVQAKGATPSEAFEAAIRQFPPNPIDGIAQWESARLTAEPGDFKEVEPNEET